MLDKREPCTIHERFFIVAVCLYRTHVRSNLALLCRLQSVGSISGFMIRQSDVANKGVFQYHRHRRVNACNAIFVDAWQATLTDPTPPCQIYSAPAC